MSHAPDAAYLASRLEGVRRNLEIEERRPATVPYDEDIHTDDEEVALAPEASEVVRQLNPIPTHRRQHHCDCFFGVAASTRLECLQRQPGLKARLHTISTLDFSSTLHPPTQHLSTMSKCTTRRDVDATTSSTLLAPTQRRQAYRPSRTSCGPRCSSRKYTASTWHLEQVRDLHAFHGDSDRVSNHLAALALFLHPLRPRHRVVPVRHGTNFIRPSRACN